MKNKSKTAMATEKSQTEAKVYCCKSTRGQQWLFQKTPEEGFDVD